MEGHSEDKMHHTDSKAELVGRDKSYLAAACGTYCGACPAYLAKYSEDDRMTMKRRENVLPGPTTEPDTIPHPSWMDGILCDGCLSSGEIAAHCQECDIKICAASKPGVTRCSECDELPCHRITKMIDTGLLHRGEYMTNLSRIREMGVHEWVKYEEERWRCPHCGVPVSWYDAECAGCGGARSERLFPLI